MLGMRDRRKEKTEEKRVPECEGHDFKYDETVPMNFEDVPTM